MQAAGLEKKYDKVVVIEFSRGCWWGQIHPCTFCGLNGKINIYREKSPQRLLEEIPQERVTVANFTALFWGKPRGL